LKKFVNEVMSNSSLVSAVSLCLGIRNVVYVFIICLSPASNSLPEATRLVNRHPNARSLLVDMLDQEQVGRLVDNADVIIRYVEPRVLQSIE
jgi:hypothetical protein